MTKVRPINSNPVNNPLNPEQQEVYGGFLAGSALDNLERISFIDGVKIDEYDSAKDAKRKKIAIYSSAGTVLFVVASLIISPRFIPNSVKERVGGWTKRKFDKLIEGATHNPKTKARYERWQTKIKNGIEYLNVFNNFSTLKDAVLRQKLYNHIAPLRWVDNKSAELYYRTSGAMCKKSFERMFKAFKASDAEIRTALRNIDPKKLDETVKIGETTKSVRKLVDDVHDLLTRRTGILKGSYGQKAQEAGRRKIVETIGGINGTQNLESLDRRFWKEFKRILKSGKKEEYRKLLNRYVVADVIEADKAKLAQDFCADALEITGNGGINARIQEILDKILDRKVMQNGITPFAQKADKRLNRALDMHTNIFVDKMRDVCVSTAASDVLGILGAGGALVLYTAQAKTKEERTSVAMTTGVPLGLGIISTTIATMKMVNGFKALGVGFATTIISGIVGKSLDKAYKKKHGIEDKKPSIPTIKLPQRMEHSRITDYVDNAANKFVN